MTRLVSSLAAALSAMFMNGAGAAGIETARGPVEIAGSPARIAVYDIPAIDTLDQLGIEIAGVPDNLFLDALKHIGDGAEIVGTLFEPDLEALSALDPDLIIVGGRSSTQLDAVARVAPAIDMTLYGVDLLPQAKARILSYGELFGREDRAAALAAELDAAVERARTAVNGKGDALILMTSGPKITAYGADSRFGWLHRELNLPAAIEGDSAAAHGEAVSFEFVREADPDWLVVVDRAAAIGSGEAAARATLDNELVRATKAWRSGQVVYLPAADFYIAAGGAAATIRVLDSLSRAFSGD